MLYTKEGRPLQTSGDFVYSRSGEVVGRMVRRSLVPTGITWERSQMIVWSIGPPIVPSEAAHSRWREVPAPLPLGRRVQVSGVTNRTFRTSAPGSRPACADG